MSTKAVNSAFDIIIMPIEREWRSIKIDVTLQASRTSKCPKTMTSFSKSFWGPVSGTQLQRLIKWVIVDFGLKNDKKKSSRFFYCHFTEFSFFFAFFSSFFQIKRSYQFRLNRERVCKDLVPSKMRVALSSGLITPLPLRCKDGTRLLLIEAGKKWKPKELDLEQIFRTVMLSLEAASAEPKTQVGEKVEKIWWKKNENCLKCSMFMMKKRIKRNFVVLGRIFIIWFFFFFEKVAGTRVIVDMDGLTLTQVTYYTPSYANMVLEWVQKCLAIRLKGIHIVNQPYIFNMVFAIFKPFIEVRRARDSIDFWLNL